MLSSENRSSFIHELNGRQVRNRFLYEDLDSSSVSIGIESNGTVISLYDRNSNSAVILLAVNSTSLTEQYLAAPLRFIFEEYFRRTSYMLIHAGGLMVDDQVTLFVGPSGQGLKR